MDVVGGTHESLAELERIEVDIIVAQMRPNVISDLLWGIVPLGAHGRHELRSCRLPALINAVKDSLWDIHKKLQSNSFVIYCYEPEILTTSKIFKGVKCR